MPRLHPDTLRRLLGLGAIVAVVVAAAAGDGTLWALSGNADDPSLKPSIDASSASPAASLDAQITAPVAAPTAWPSPSAAPLSAAAATPLPRDGAAPAPAAKGAPSPVPLVPVVGYWSTERSISLGYLKALIGGAGVTASEDPSAPPRVVAIAIDDLAPLAAFLRVTPRGVMAMPAAQIKSLVKTTPNLIGIIRADDVTPDVRALGIDGFQLFGAARSNVWIWPLLVDEPGVASPFVTASEWTLATGGDVMLDKAVYRQSRLTGLGSGYAWLGGTAVIDKRYCCGWGGKPLVVGHQTGAMGAVGRLFREADLAIVNLESPEPDRFRYHATGFTFTGDPALLVGLKDAGIDLAGLANNHLGNGGTKGILDTIRHLDQLGVAHAGAGANSAAARNAAWLKAGGLRIAVLAYSQIDPFSYWATPNHPGSAGYSMAATIRGIRAAKSAGADMVIVMPHWGAEYTDSVMAVQRADARKMVAAGADLILGSHSHWVGPFEQVSAGHFVFYSLGDLVFDWTHDERTQEGVVADLTFVGTRVVQIDLHPTLIIAGQPNLLDPAGGGQAVLGAVRRTSQPSLRW